MNGNERSRVLSRMKLREPLKEALGFDTNALEQAHNWGRIAHRLDATSKRTAPRQFVLPLLALVSLATVFWVVNARWASSTEPTQVTAATPVPRVDVPTPSRSPDLKLADGTEFKRLAIGSLASEVTESTRATFEDGSTLTAVGPDTVVEPLAMTERDVTLRLASGSIDVSVKKGGARKWVIEAGELSVEVVGTQFVVTRTADHAAVSVKEGVVLVRSTKLPDGVKRLIAGQSEHIPRQSPTGNHTAPSFESVLRKADTARQAGDLQAASIHFQHLLNAFPKDARTGVVAFQLALVVQQMGASPERVVKAFESALSKAHGQSLRQDCYWRLVLALEHAGDIHGAQQRAHESLSAYPNGRYAAELGRRVPNATHSPGTSPRTELPHQ